MASVMGIILLLFNECFDFGLRRIRLIRLVLIPPVPVPVVLESGDEDNDDDVDPTTDRLVIL